MFLSGYALAQTNSNFGDSPASKSPGLAMSLVEASAVPILVRFVGINQEFKDRNDYTLGGHIGAGVHNCVYLATENSTGRQVAIREDFPFDYGLKSWPSLRKIFLPSGLKSIGVVPYLGFSQPGTSVDRFSHEVALSALYIMEHMPNGTLGDLRERIGLDGEVNEFTPTVHSKVLFHMLH
jgi:hypothetical protein